MGAKFKVGDQVRLKPEHREGTWPGELIGGPHVVTTITKVEKTYRESTYHYWVKDDKREDNNSWCDTWFEKVPAKKVKLKDLPL